ncbi:hypothetical protein DIPPA_25875 [Diplonema papillatum]|nr:hypothetical protein DIPPA_25875 [Diplonema papillatum]
MPPIVRVRVSEASCKSHLPLVPATDDIYFKVQISGTQSKRSTPGERGDGVVKWNDWLAFVLPEDQADGCRLRLQVFHAAQGAKPACVGQTETLSIGPEDYTVRCCPLTDKLTNKHIGEAFVEVRFRDGVLKKKAHAPVPLLTGDPAVVTEFLSVAISVCAIFCWVNAYDSLIAFGLILLITSCGPEVADSVVPVALLAFSCRSWLSVKYTSWNNQRYQALKEKVGLVPRLLVLKEHSQKSSKNATQVEYFVCACLGGLMLHAVRGFSARGQFRLAWIPIVLLFLQASCDVPLVPGALCVSMTVTPFVFSFHLLKEKIPWLPRFLDFTPEFIKAPLPFSDKLARSFALNIIGDSDSDQTTPKRVADSSSSNLLGGVSGIRPIKPLMTSSVDISPQNTPPAPVAEMGVGRARSRTLDIGTPSENFNGFGFVSVPDLLRRRTKKEAADLPLLVDDEPAPLAAAPPHPGGNGGTPAPDPKNTSSATINASFSQIPMNATIATSPAPRPKESSPLPPGRVFSTSQPFLSPTNSPRVGVVGTAPIYCAVACTIPEGKDVMRQLADLQEKKTKGVESGKALKHDINSAACSLLLTLVEQHKLKYRNTRQSQAIRLFLLTEPMRTALETHIDIKLQISNRGAYYTKAFLPINKERDLSVPYRSAVKSPPSYKQFEKELLDLISHCPHLYTVDKGFRQVVTVDDWERDTLVALSYVAAELFSPRISIVCRMVEPQPMLVFVTKLHPPRPGPTESKPCLPDDYRPEFNREVIPPSLLRQLVLASCGMKTSVAELTDQLAKVKFQYYRSLEVMHFGDRKGSVYVPDDDGEPSDNRRSSRSTRKKTYSRKSIA